MLRNLSQVIHKGIHATDGDIGKVSDFFFDDSTWTIRYMVAETGNWLAGREVLISPSAFKAIDWEAGLFLVNLTKEQVQKSPNVDTKLPVSRQQEEDLANHYNWPIYWGGGYAGVFGSFPTMSGMVPVPMRVETDPPEPVSEKNLDPHLRSTKEVTGYHISAKDGDIGHVADFTIDDATWSVQFLVVDTTHWLPGKQVLISPNVVQRVDWIARKVFVNLSMESIKSSPEFDPSHNLSESYEDALHIRDGVKSKDGAKLI